MDTERDENQNLISSDINKTRQDLDTKAENYQNRYDNEAFQKEHQEEHNDVDDQNNSSTGYTEKLLEKEFEIDNNKGTVTEDIEPIEEDLIIKNGNIIDNDCTEESIKKQKEKIDESDRSLYNDNDDITENPKFAVD